MSFQRFSRPKYDMLSCRIEKVLDEGQTCEQAGFRKGFSTIDHIHTVSKLVEVPRKYKPLCLTFIDLKKAFDQVETEAVLDNQGVPTQYIKVLRELYTNFTTGIAPFYNNIIIDVKRGVRQGDTISPKIFTDIFENAMGKLEWDEMGVKVDGRQLHHLRFADDIVLITPSISQPERMLTEFDETCGCIGLQPNLQKTMFMRNGCVSDAPFTLKGTNISECTSYVHLSRELNMMNDLTPELGRRRRAAWRAYKSIEDVVKKTRNTRLRAHLFNTTVLPALTYASETWAFRKQEENAVNVIERAIERVMLGVSRFTQVRDGIRMAWWIFVYCFLLAKRLTEAHVCVVGESPKLKQKETEKPYCHVEVIFEGTKCSSEITVHYNVAPHWSPSLEAEITERQCEYTYTSIVCFCIGDKCNAPEKLKRIFAKEIARKDSFQELQLLLCFVNDGNLFVNGTNPFIPPHLSSTTDNVKSRGYVARPRVADRGLIADQKRHCACPETQVDSGDGLPISADPGLTHDIPVSRTTIISWDLFATLAGFWDIPQWTASMRNMTGSLNTLTTARRRLSFKSTKRRLSLETLELIRQRGAARAAGNQEFTSELARFCREAIKEDLKERRAEVLAEAAEAGKAFARPVETSPVAK
ncbi:hypothetical protein RB195_026538 [Necator americanus]|uniref:Reverse transcriptase domain-containing protein n=1 Tax=Necator americanus TaxID=51031 RepID=A0ABR1EWK2_NECAM